MGRKRPTCVSRYQTRPEVIREKVERWLTANKWLASAALHAFEVGHVMNSVDQRGEVNRRRLPCLRLELWRSSFGFV
jgi:hypothetical protein